MCTNGAFQKSCREDRAEDGRSRDGIEDRAGAHDAAQRRVRSIAKPVSCIMLAILAGANSCIPPSVSSAATTRPLAVRPIQTARCRFRSFRHLPSSMRVHRFRGILYAWMLINCARMNGVFVV